ncbi:Helix-loop-helix DNA-binding domain protein [Trichostrongylus colubriformis]|uniref:Helix-loop-helix DNA-binding domain protein n=1 Tax=Trichostrongylus colubriformis TaxID=6319 RepID=A0AAN8FPF6_TRICO
MLRCRLHAGAVTKEAIDGEPLDLSVPKCSTGKQESEDTLCKTVTKGDSGSQLLMKILQQQLLLSMFARPDLGLINEPGTLHKREKGRTEIIEQREQLIGHKRRSEANARERNRVQHLGDMFDKLKSVLPIELDVKISKLATLRIASAYIRYLGCVLDTENICLLMESEQALMLRICEARSCPKKI